MNALKLCLSSLRMQGLSTLLTLALLALGVATIVTTLLIADELERTLTRDARGIDAVVGAKGSAMQLVLSSVLHLDIPTGNIPQVEAARVIAHPQVATSIPLALGDSFAGFRIVGTSHDYVAHYSGQLADGQLWQQPLEAVLGSSVAAATGLRVGATFVGSHGISGGITRHENQPYTVSGVLNTTGSVLDRLVLTDVASVWAVHEHEGETDTPAARREITAMLIRYRSPVAALTFPRSINESSALQAASPAFELTRLLAFIGTGVDVFRAFSFVLVIVAALSLFITLYRTLDDQRYDLALMRSLGASRRRIFSHVLGQGLLMGLGGCGFGLLIGHGGAAAIATWLRIERGIAFTGISWLEEEVWVIAIALIIATLAAVIPAWRAYRMEISAVLAGR